MAAEHATVDMNDIAGLARLGLQPPDHVGVAALRHEADVLAVVLVGDVEPEFARGRARLGLGHAAEREAEEIELLARGGEQEIALVAVEIDRAEQSRAGRQRRGS